MYSSTLSWSSSAASRSEVSALYMRLAACSFAFIVSCSLRSSLRAKSLPFRAISKPLSALATNCFFLRTNRHRGRKLLCMTNSTSPRTIPAKKNTEHDNRCAAPQTRRSDSAVAEIGAASNAPVYTGARPRGRGRLAGRPVPHSRLRLHAGSRRLREGARWAPAPMPGGMR